MTPCKQCPDKQMPKKPIKRSFVIPYQGINVCPNCKEPISRKRNHCRWCGQALDWKRHGEDSGTE
jgi:predicted amidophosphoribosyltransferase